MHRAVVGGELVVGDQHQVGAVQGGREVEPAGGVEDLGLDAGQDRSPGWSRYRSTAPVKLGSHAVSRRT